jgi:hypothetical protein
MFNGEIFAVEVPQGLELAYFNIETLRNFDLVQ